MHINKIKIVTIDTSNNYSYLSLFFLPFLLSVPFLSSASFVSAVSLCRRCAGCDSALLLAAATDATDRWWHNTTR